MKDQFTKQWITENSINIISRYANGVLTIRGLHYQLVGLGMTNSMRHYKRVVNAMIDARREGDVSYYAFSDRDRSMDAFTDWKEISYGSKVRTAKEQVEAWAMNYSLNRWENQDYYPEIWIEKKALIGSFEKPCREHRIALAACKGYPSLTFLREGADRFIDARDEGKTPMIIYFGDYDPSGEDIPRSIRDNMIKDFGVDVDVNIIALNESQVVQWDLPPAPAKSGDSRTANWDGLGQVELDAVSPERLETLIHGAVDDIFDQDKYEELLEREKSERVDFRSELKQHIIDLSDDDDSDDGAED